MNMNIEICAGTRDAIIVTAICVAACFLALLCYRYNSLAYEKGYTQKQIEHSTQTMWVKP